MTKIYTIGTWIPLCLILTGTIVHAQNTIELHTGDNINYQFFPITSNELRFKVRAKNDAHVALTSDFGIPTLCEIVLGGWDNTKSVIRKRGTDRGSQDGPMVDGSNFISFRVTWSEDTLSIYKEGNNNAIFTLADQDLIHIKYYGFHTGFKADGDWIITDPNGSTDLECDDTSKELYTGDDIDYQFSPATSNTLAFKVKARNDAHIALTSDFGIPTLYEIVLGGWDNTKSVIRKRGNDRASYPGQMLIKNRYTTFRITWAEDTLLVYKEGVLNPVFTLKDSDLKLVKYVGFHTGFKSDGYWTFTDPSASIGPGCSVTAGLYTGDDTNYQFSPISSNHLSFKVKARNDAHIAFTSDFGIPTLVEIVLGGWANTNSVIRKHGKDRGSYPGQIVSGSKYLSFRVTWSEDTLSVFKEGVHNPILVLRDEDLKHIKYFGVHTGFEADGSWIFSDLSNSLGHGCGTWRELFSGDNTNYQFYPTPTSNVLNFKVKAKNDAHIALSLDYAVPTLYEIVLGGWSNTNSVIRRRNQERASFAGSMLEETKYTSFTIRWTRDTITVVKEGVNSPIFVLKDNDVKRIKYFGIHTGFGALGYWKFVDPNSPAGEVCNATKEGSVTLTKPVVINPTIPSQRSCTIPTETEYGSFWATCEEEETYSTSNITAGKKAGQGCKLRVRCKSGYYARDDDSATAVCSGNSWYPTVPVCTRVCRKLTPGNVDLICIRNRIEIPCSDVLLSGTKVKISCKPNYRQEYVVSYAEIQCDEHGEWNYPLFKCSAECGRVSQNPTTLIFNGTKESIGDSPWHVAVYDVLDRKNINLVCGGTIITPQLVVSAAHCFFNSVTSKKNDANRYEIVVSKITRDYTKIDNTLQRTYKVKEIRFPEKGFLGITTNYVSDLALVILTEKIELNNFVLPACLDWSGQAFNPAEGSYGKVVGWGVDGVTSGGSEILLAANLPYISYSKCVKIISEEFKTFVTIDKFCAGSETGPGVREGDSGGGLLFKHQQLVVYFLRGVVSLKPNVNTSIAMFTDVSQYMEWISKVRNELEDTELRRDTSLKRKTKRKIAR